MIRCANPKKVLFALYLVVGIYVAVMYLLCAFRGEQRSYSMMMNLSLAFGILSGIVFVESDRLRWIVPLSMGVLWGSGVAIEGILWENYVFRDLLYLLLFFGPFLAVWVLSRIKKGRNIILAFVGAVFSLFSLGLLPGREKLEPLYDILFVVMPVMTFAIIAKSQSQRQRWIYLLIFLVVYSYVIVANPYINLAMFVIVATALVMVLAILSAAWKDKIKKMVFVIMVCLMSAFAVIAIPSWASFATMRFCYPEYVRSVDERVEFESAFVTPENDTISWASLQGKTVVLYFWIASCGTCYDMMPDYSAFAESYADSLDNVFYAVFLGNHEKELRHYEETTSNDYAFRWARALDAEEVMEKMGFNLFPHLTIISSDGMVVYNGPVDFRQMNVFNSRRYLNQ